MTEAMVSPEVVKALGGTHYNWIIKLEVKDCPNVFAKEFSFKGSYEQAQMQGDIACGLVSSSIRIGRVLLERGEECLGTPT